MMCDFELNFQAFRSSLLTMLTAKPDWLSVFICVYHTKEFVCLNSLTTETIGTI